jgi:hypothetical protein
VPVLLLPVSSVPLPTSCKYLNGAGFISNAHVVLRDWEF